MKDFYANIFTDEYPSYYEDYEPKLKKGPYGNYYTIGFDRKKRRKVKRIARRHRIKIRLYESRWERSGDYRRVFYKHYKGPYRCRYCRKKLNKEIMEIDHLVPVNRVKKGAYARFLLRIRGINNVNDYRNLVPSCKKCNRKKADKLGVWFIKGLLGKYKIFWIIYYLIQIFFISAIVFCIYSNYQTISQLFR